MRFPQDLISIVGDGLQRAVGPFYDEASAPGRDERAPRGAAGKDGRAALHGGHLALHGPFSGRLHVNDAIVGLTSGLCRKTTSVPNTCVVAPAKPPRPSREAPSRTSKISVCGPSGKSAVGRTTVCGRGSPTGKPASGESTYRVTSTALRLSVSRSMRSGTLPVSTCPSGRPVKLAAATGLPARVQHGDDAQGKPSLAGAIALCDRRGGVQFKPVGSSANPPTTLTLRVTCALSISHNALGCCHAWKQICAEGEPDASTAAESRVHRPAEL